MFDRLKARLLGEEEPDEASVQDDATVEACVLALKDRPDVDNPHALCQWMKNQGMTLPGSPAEVDAVLERVTAEAPGLVRAQAARASINPRGRFLTPGTFTPHINGEPAEVEFPESVIVDAGKQLQARVENHEPVFMRLSHPDLGVPIEVATVTGVGVDEDEGEVWITDTELFPAAKTVLTEEAREKIMSMGLSVDAGIQLKPVSEEDNEFLATGMTVEAVDIVSKGAFDGSDITDSVPSELAARLAAAHPGRPGDCGRTVSGQEDSPMPTFDSIEDLPESVRGDLTPEQQAEYLDTYNTAIEDGETPAEAHQIALENAMDEGPGDDGEGSAGREPAEDDSQGETHTDDEDTDEDSAMSQEPNDNPANDADDVEAKLAAKEDRIEELEAQLKAAEEDKDDLQARLGDLENSVEDLKAKKRGREAEELVMKHIRAGKATPGEKEDLLNACLSMGKEDFESMMSKRDTVVPPGERGAQPQDDEVRGSGPSDDAERLIANLGVKGVLQASLHDPKKAEGAEEMRKVLALEYGDRPEVVRNLGRSTIKEIQAEHAPGGDV